jgi:hypothetical protein
MFFPVEFLSQSAPPNPAARWILPYPIHINCEHFLLLKSTIEIRQMIPGQHRLLSDLGVVGTPIVGFFIIMRGHSEGAGFLRATRGSPASVTF